MFNCFEIGATLFGLIQGVLVMFNKRSNWIAYSIQMALMIMFSLSMHLYGDVVNSSIYLVLGIIGFIIWNKKDEKDIEECNKKEKIIYILIIAVLTAIAFTILRKTDDPLPLLDAFTTTSSLVATYYMMIKKIDTWIIWFINDIFYAIEYFILPDQALSLFFLNAIWTIMAVISYINWKKIMKGERKNMKKIYFAGKFKIDKDKSLPLFRRLRHDFRAKVLEDSKKLTNAEENVKMSNGHIYSGPFYCEQASNGDFTSTDCNVVLNSEHDAVCNSDIYFAVFDQKFSVGTIVELGWALEMNKEIIIFYKEEESAYDIKSEYWFAIANALSNSDKVKVFKFKDINEVVNIIKEGVIFNEVQRV